MSPVGTKQTWRDVRLGSGMRTITDIDQWGAKPTDLHLLSTVHCVDDEIMGWWLARRERRHSVTGHNADMAFR
jgi:hypothetical protein